VGWDWCHQFCALCDTAVIINLLILMEMELSCVFCMFVAYGLV
jgi:hypothetical protein